MGCKSWSQKRSLSLKRGVQRDGLIIDVKQRLRLLLEECDIRHRGHESDVQNHAAPVEYGFLVPKDPAGVEEEDIGVVAIAPNEGATGDDHPHDVANDRDRNDLFRHRAHCSP